jgi:aspartate aminotransferase
MELRDLLTDGARSIGSSVTQEMNAKAKFLASQGHDVVNLSVGEPDFEVPEHVKQAMVEALHDNDTHYSPGPGLGKLRAAISSKWAEKGIIYDPSQIVVSNGGKGALTKLFDVTLQPGDEVIIPEPYWVSYPEMVRVAGATPIFSGFSGDDFQFDIEVIARQITGRTKFIVYSSPNNPAGSLQKRPTLERLANLILGSGVSVVSDEMYSDITFGDNKHVSIASLAHDQRYGGRYERLADHVFVLDGASKSYAMTGLRVGWIGCPEYIVNTINAAKSHTEGNVNNTVQRGAIAALQGDQSFTQDMVETFSERGSYVLQALLDIPGVECHEPEGAFYLFPDISSYYGRLRLDNGTPIKGSVDMANYLLEQAHVAVSPGVAFGLDDHIRLSYAASMPSLHKGAERNAKALGQLKQA